MKIQVICETCSSIGEFIPHRNHEAVGIQSNYRQFRVGLSWQNEVIENVQQEFVEKLGRAATDTDRKKILEDGLSDNAYAETVDFYLSFTSRGCGDRITLNDFQLTDLIGF